MGQESTDKSASADRCAAVPKPLAIAGRARDATFSLAGSGSLILGSVALFRYRMPLFEGPAHPKSRTSPRAKDGTQRNAVSVNIAVLRSLRRHAAGRHMKNIGAAR